MASESVTDNEMSYAMGFLSDHERLPGSVCAERFVGGIIALRNDLADANARCADLTARLDRERGARMAAVAERDTLRAKADTLAASLDECARLLGCERGGAVEALRRRVPPQVVDVAIPADDDCEWCGPDCMGEPVMHPLTTLPTPEPVTWAVGDRVQRAISCNIGHVVAVDDDRLRVEWERIGSEWVSPKSLARLPPEPVVTHSGPVVVTPAGKWVRTPDPRDARIAELERERDEARAKLERIRVAATACYAPTLRIDGVISILNEGDV